ncbi:MAG: hypothetical protein NDJ94_14095 [Vicinamibacteria bacterium]|jgi:hypothetical protein|nr:hypothetical protein [Vicinamibacteria bacterium]
MVVVPLHPPADLAHVSRVLWAIAAMPHRRDRPVAGDLEGDWDFWFDGGACRCTTDVNNFTLQDGSEAWLSTSSLTLRGGVRLPDGKVVTFGEERKPTAATCVGCGREITAGSTFVQTPRGPAHAGCA